MISIILPTYNRGHLISRAINSVLKQTYKNFELIVVDDGSTDNTRKVIKKFNDPRIRYLRNTKNQGANKARNIGIKATVGEYIAFQDSDDVWLPNKLEEQMRVFNNCNNKVGVVYCGYLKHHSGNRFISGPSEPMEGDIQKSLANGNFIGTQTAILKMKCFEKAGLFDGRMPRRQDWEMWIRVSKYYHFKFVDKPLLIIYPQVESISTNRKSFVKAIYIMLGKHYDFFKQNKKSLSGFYFEIGNFLYFNKINDGNQWKRYYCSGIKTNPFSIFTYLRIVSFILCNLGNKKIIRSNKNIIFKSIVFISVKFSNLLKFR